MLLYHCSNQQFSVLLPKLGGSRHGDEDPRAVGKLVVWLSNDQKMYRQDSSGAVDVYQHEVDIDQADPNLLMDAPFAELMKGMPPLIPASPLRWYFYLGQLEVVKVRKWDATTSSYT